MYRVRGTTRARARAPLGAGTIRRSACGRELLESEFGLGIDVYSVTSFTELRREAMALTRAQRLDAAPAPSWIERQLPADGTPVVAASDYVSAVADLIRPWIRDRYLVLGTDGFGRSDTRAALRSFFEVDRRSIALTTLAQIDPALAQRARSLWGIHPSAPPWTR